LFLVFDVRWIPPRRAGACNTLKEPAGGLCGILNETLLHIGDGGDSTSHGVCRLIDDRGIDGDLISHGVGGLVDNRGISVD